MLLKRSRTQVRYALKLEGELFHSCIKAFRLENLLSERAMHSLVNLRPLCGAMKIWKGKQVHKGA